MFYTFVWTSPGYSISEQIPLKGLCESISKSNSTTYCLNIVFIEGFEYLSQEYLQSLQYENVTIINYSKEFKLIKEKYKEVFNHYSVFESYCFLRWICLKDLAKSQNNDQIWHIDSDVVLHIPLDEIAQNTKGKTFMLEGCPVLASISNYEWFSIYESQLEALICEPKVYSDVASKSKRLNSKKDVLLCNQSNYRNPIGSDQDLLQYLIGSKIQIQELSENIFTKSIFLIQNPLHLNDWHAFQGQVSTGSFKSNNFEIIVNGEKKLAFTHFQGNFTTYCNLFYFLNKLFIPDRIKKYILKFSIKNEKFHVTKIAFLTRVFINRTGLALSRSQVVNKFSENNNYYLIRVLNFLAAK